MNWAAARCGQRRPEQMTGPHPMCVMTHQPHPSITSSSSSSPRPSPPRSRLQTVGDSTARTAEGMRTHQLHRTIVFPAEVSPPAAQVLRGRAADRKRKKKKRERSVGRSVSWSVGRSERRTTQSRGVGVKCDAAPT